MPKRPLQNAGSDPVEELISYLQGVPGMARFESSSLSTEERYHDQHTLLLRCAIESTQAAHEYSEGNPVRQRHLESAARSRMRARACELIADGASIAAAVANVFNLPEPNIESRLKTQGGATAGSAENIEEKQRSSKKRGGAATKKRSAQAAPSPSPQRMADAAPPSSSSGSGSNEGKQSVMSNTHDKSAGGITPKSSASESGAKAFERADRVGLSFRVTSPTPKRLDGCIGRCVKDHGSSLVLDITDFKGKREERVYPNTAVEPVKEQEQPMRMTELIYKVCAEGSEYAGLYGRLIARRGNVISLEIPVEGGDWIEETFDVAELLDASRHLFDEQVRVSEQADTAKESLLAQLRALQSLEDYERWTGEHLEIINLLPHAERNLIVAAMEVTMRALHYKWKQEQKKPGQENPGERDEDKMTEKGEAIVRQLVKCETTNQLEAAISRYRLNELETNNTLTSADREQISYALGVRRARIAEQTATPPATVGPERRCGECGYKPPSHSLTCKTGQREELAREASQQPQKAEARP